ncbi:putative transcription factor B3-Domain family [Helianthus annuus]|nr:putative transcription factor B3-Domain family [Helianthus annuus]KAJ0573460.1 putative transcription factor B3-Domain family [Helianthus annuus]
MAPAFVKIIYDASPSSLPLPPFYNDAVRNLGFHVGHVTLRTGSQLWHVYIKVIKVTTNGCFITDGWSNVFTDLGIEETDFIFFEVLPENTIHIYHFKIDRDLDVKDNFYHVMMFPEAKNLWLPKKFMEHNFNDDLLENNVTIRYSPNQERTVRIKKLWDIHYYILDFSQISTDLSLVKWDFLVFHRVETYTFNLIVFRLHGDGSLVAEMGIPLPEQQPIPEPEYQAENDIEDTDNQLVKSYRMVRDSFQENPQVSLKLRLIGRREKDGRTYNLPTASEVAALIVGDLDSAIDSRDIVVETQTGDLKRISELHPSYLALQYPILFPYGDDSYRVDIPHRGVVDVTNKKRPNCTMREFFAYRVQDRINQFSLILNSRRLFQQFLVDAYTMIETERLNYIRHQQKNLRSDTYDSLQKLKNNGQQDISKAGKSVMLPSSFTGGARYMMQNYLDAMSLCKCFGYPDFFITITCNPKWPEVTRFLRDTTLKPEDRPDILSRLFKLKLDAICKDLKERHLLGKAAAVVYTTEFQKRGLPHAHLCLFMEDGYKLPTVDHVDAFICAEIPNRNEDPELYTLVKDYMIHGPCGLANLSCPCMVDRKCSKGFPKKFEDHTTLDSNGFPVYRRRNDGATVIKNRIELDKRSVVPYNKKLLKRYQAYINVEWCN